MQHLIELTIFFIFKENMNANMFMMSHSPRNENLNLLVPIKFLYACLEKHV
jgi:hypothetical protein